MDGPGHQNRFKQRRDELETSINILLQIEGGMVILHGRARDGNGAVFSGGSHCPEENWD